MLVRQVTVLENFSLCCSVNIYIYSYVRMYMCILYVSVCVYIYINVLCAHTHKHVCQWTLENPGLLVDSTFHSYLLDILDLHTVRVTKSMMAFYITFDNQNNLLDILLPLYKMGFDFVLPRIITSQ